MNGPGRRLGALLVLAVAACASAPDRPARPPNILFLFADDLRRDAIGAFGGVNTHTPNLDALAARGTLLTNVYCMGSPHGAVCAPSRAMVMSGRYLTHVREDLDGIPTLPELLREHGYRTFMTGKWHNGDAALCRAFPDARTVFRGGMGDHFHLPVNDVTAGTIGAQRRGDRHSSELFADAAIDFLRAHADDPQPFFSYVAFTAPHDPRDPPPAWLERLQDLAPPPLPRNFRGQHGLDLGDQTMTVRDENLLGWPRDPAQLQQQLVEYRALVAHLDEQLGRILDALAAAGHGNDTFVVFASDHGLALGSHGLLGKQSLYEHSMGSPVVFAGPDVPAGQRRDGLAYLLDLMPTMLDAAGTPPADGVDGRNLWPMVRGDGSGRDEVVLLYADTQRAIRVGDHKLIRLPQIDRTLTFDLAADPDELHDLTAGAVAWRQDLEARLRAAQAGLGEPLPWTAATVRPATVDLAGKRFPPDRWQPRWIVDKYFPASPAGRRQ